MGNTLSQVRARLHRRDAEYQPSNHTSARASQRRNSLRAVTLIEENDDEIALRKVGVVRATASRSITDGWLEVVFKKIAEDGQLTLEEFQHACTEDLQLGLTKIELERVFNFVDRERKGWVDREQFVFGVRRSSLLKNIISSFKVHQKFEVADDYDYSKTTCENYGVPVEEGFVGKYADIREQQIDYTYHTNYSHRRQAWQDAVIDAIVSRTEPQARPWIVYTAGAMGVGKGYSLTWLSSNGIFPLENIVHIDPDHFKNMMPEWKQYVANDLVSAGSLCHKESGFLQEIAQETALRRQQNIWVDGSLRDGEWFIKVFRDIRRRYPNFRIAIFHIFATEELVRSRVTERAKKTGRMVPEAKLRESLEATEKSVTMLLPYVDFVARIRNTQGEPVLEAVEEVARNPAWSVIQSRFARTQPSDGEFPRGLSPLRLEPVDLADADFDLTPEIRQNITDAQRTDLYKVRFKLGNTDLHISPVSPVNLDSAARVVANIPNDAHLFAWFHGDPNACTHTSIHHDAPSCGLQCHGGYVYFNTERRIVQVNVATQAKSDNLVQFGAAHHLPEHVEQALQGRFRPITLKFQLVKKASHIAWILPGEVIEDTAFGSFGGFAFLFDKASGIRSRYFPVMS